MLLTVKCPLAFVSLAQVEGQFVLCASEFSQSIHVCLPLKQFVDAFWVTVVGGVVEGSPLAVVSRLDVSAISQEEFDCFEAAFLACEVERSAFEVVLPLKFGLVHEQERDQLCVVV